MRLQRSWLSGLSKTIIGLALVCFYGYADSTYIVRKADTLSAIAKRHDLRVEDLVRYNDLSDADSPRIGQEIRIPDKPGVPLRYTVQKGDNLDAIARRHNLPLSTLISYNQLQNPDKLSVGNVILLPTDRNTSAPIPASTLSPSIKKKLNQTRVSKNRWRYIVIHHSASKSGTPKGMDEYHRRKRRMKNGLAYHFVIGNGYGMTDGEIAIGHRWTKQIQGGHLASETLNKKSIGICLIGNFDHAHPTPRQMNSLKALLHDLMRRCNVRAKNVRTHQEINTKPTRCPGKHFNINVLRSAL